METNDKKDEFIGFRADEDLIRRIDALVIDPKLRLKRSAKVRYLVALALEALAKPDDAKRQSDSSAT